MPTPRLLTWRRHGHRNIFHRALECIRVWHAIDIVGVVGVVGGGSGP